MLQAVSVSRTVTPLVGQPGFQAHVLASFRSACNLLAADGSVVTVVTRAVGDGPLSIVVDGEEGLPTCQAGAPVVGNGRALDVGGAWQVNLAGAAVWEPTPDYRVFRRLTTNDLIAVLSHLGDLLAAYAPSESLATLRSSRSQDDRLLPYHRRAQKYIASLLVAYDAGELEGISGSAAGLVGLGPGLTPAGDDWLAGWLVGLRTRGAFLFAEDKLGVTDVAKAILHAAEDRTHVLSLALLRAAAAGEVNAHWHALLPAIAERDVPAVEVAAAGVMKYGETSGSDMLAGFLSALMG
ncbi:MAG: DUF2877 domain-containing protein [Anaerolineae bacterium]|nr:DUF2877 domain-containing protein [Anaerolineae bacterium]